MKISISYTEASTDDLFTEKSVENTELPSIAPPKSPPVKETVPEPIIEPTPKPKTAPKEQLTLPIIQEKVVEAAKTIETKEAVSNNIDISSSSKTERTDTSAEVNNNVGADIERSSRLTPFEDISTGLNLPEPDYPQSAIKWKKEGIVEVEIEINPDGSIEDVVLIKSSGHKILDNHCIKTIKKSWTFNNRGTTTITRRKFVFKLL